MLAEADYNTTMQAHEPKAGDDQLLVRFFTKPRQDQAASKEAGRPIFKDTVYVSIIQPGNKDNIIERPASEMDIQRFPRHYEAFKTRTSEEHIEGTPLEEWPGITRSQVEELRYFHIRTVEQLVNLSDSGAQNIMGVNMLKDKARKYLEAAEDNKAAEELAARDAEIERLNKLVEGLSARLDELEVDED